MGTDLPQVIHSIYATNAKTIDSGAARLSKVAPTYSTHPPRDSGSTSGTITHNMRHCAFYFALLALTVLVCESCGIYIDQSSPMLPLFRSGSRCLRRW